MMTINLIDNHFSEHLSVISESKTSLSSHIEHASSLLANALKKSGTVYWFGNGGSASDSQHLAAELIGRFKNDRIPLRSIALNTDTSVLTCVANDFSFDDIFSRQLEALIRPGDVVVGLSTSGLSLNVLNAFEFCKNFSDVKTIGLLGKDGGKAKDLVDLALIVPSFSTARIQEAHILIGHILCDLIERELGLA